MPKAQVYLTPPCGHPRTPDTTSRADARLRAQLLLTIHTPYGTQPYPTQPLMEEPMGGLTIRVSEFPDIRR